MNNFLSNLKNTIKGADFFAIPVQLTYKSSRKFNTVVGGCCTLLIILAIFVTFPLLLLHDLSNTQFQSVTPTWRQFSS